MNISPRQLIIVSAIGFAISFVVHLLTVFALYQVSNNVIMILTAGILIVWLQSSKNLKVMHRSNPERHPWKTAISLCPEWIKYLFYFFILYALINFGLTMSFGKSDEFFNFEVSQVKLRGISGFWMVFYVLGLIFGFSFHIYLKKSNVKSYKN